MRNVSSVMVRVNMGVVRVISVSRIVVRVKSVMTRVTS